MEVLEIYIRTQDSLDILAGKLSHALGADMEKRYGTNRGGTYYQTDVVGLTCELLMNAGEAATEREGEWAFYLIVYCDEYTISLPTLRCLADHICMLLRRYKLETDVHAL